MIRASSLVVTADDLGQSAARNRAILQTLQRGYATHTSLIVNLEGFDEAYELIRAERLEGVVGLHLNFTDGAPLTDGMKRSARFCVDGRFRFPMLGRGLLPLTGRRSGACAGRGAGAVGARTERRLSHHPSRFTPPRPYDAQHGQRAARGGDRARRAARAAVQ